MPNLDKNPQGGVGGTSAVYDFGTTPNTRTAISQKVRLLTPHYGSAATLSQMGVISNINRSQSKSIEPVRGVGFGDKIAELVPSVTEPTTLSIERALLYLCNLWQATGYASGVDGPVRSLAHHKWPFDLEEQMVFSTLVDVDLNGANIGYNNGAGGTAGRFDGGIRAISFPQVTDDSRGMPGQQRGHSALITMYEACWWQQWSASTSKDQAVIMESGDCMVTDIHDFASNYGEFLATGNDPTLGQLGSVRFADQGFQIVQAGSGAGLGGAQGIVNTNSFDV
jgi:hypothetical protein